MEEAEEYSESEEEKLPTGPFGEIYPSSSSGEEIENGAPKRLFIPRCKMQAYKQAEGQVLREKKNNPLKFTAGTDPRTRDIMSFIVDESIGCPQFLPMDYEDAKLTNIAIEAAIL